MLFILGSRLSSLMLGLIKTLDLHEISAPWSRACVGTAAVLKPVKRHWRRRKSCPREKTEHYSMRKFLHRFLSGSVDGTVGEGAMI